MNSEDDGRDASQDATDGSGWVRIASETTLASKTIIRWLPPRVPIGQREIDSPEWIDVPPDLLVQVGGFVVLGGELSTEDVAGLFLHRMAGGGHPDTQLPLQFRIDVADGDGRQTNGETYPEAVGRLTNARTRAEEIVLAGLVRIEVPELAPIEASEEWQATRTPDTWLASWAERMHWAERMQETPETEPATEEIDEKPPLDGVQRGFFSGGPDGI